VSLDPQLKALMIHTITVEHYSGMAGTGYASRVYSTSSTFKARVEFKSRLVKGKDMKDAVSNTTVFTPMHDVNGSTSATIGLSDRITLPAQFTPRTPPIIAVQPHYDHEGPHHYEVLL
jgi:hypothetical protein